MAGRGVLLYDYFVVRGGAERVSVTLARQLPNCTLCFAGRNKRAWPDQMFRGLHAIDLGGGAGPAPWRAMRVLRRFRKNTAFLSDYDWALYSGFYAPVSVHNGSDRLNMLYCHTPPRFAYDLRNYYLERLPPPLRPAFRWLSRYVKSEYEAALARMDRVFANSANVKERLRRHLGRDAEVVYPPCDVDSFTWQGQGDYYLSLARLEEYKRVDRLIMAFRHLPHRRLVVASGGRQYRRLLRLAAGMPNVHFTGWLDETALNRLIGSAIATLYIPKDEDFGISPVESMAAGKPVIGVAEGGLLETVVHGETGLLLAPDPGVEEIATAVEDLSRLRAGAMRSACEQRARMFRAEVFTAKMRSILL
jgi:glycosyltransferase involved in cell wall biosynthesis